MPSPTSRNPDPTTHIFGRYRLSCTLKISISYIGRQAFRDHQTHPPRYFFKRVAQSYRSGGSRIMEGTMTGLRQSRDIWCEESIQTHQSVPIEFKEILLQANVHINRIELQSRPLYMIKPSALHNLGFPQQRTTQCSTFSIPKSSPLPA